jgi:hypothetical protein
MEDRMKKTNRHNAYKGHTYERVSSTMRAPTFAEQQGFLIVKFNARMVAGGMVRVGSKVESQPERWPELQPESLDQRVLALLEPRKLGKVEISARLGQQGVSGHLNKIIRKLMRQGLIEYTLSDKPNSRLQKYRLMEKGRRTLHSLVGGS